MDGAGESGERPRLTPADEVDFVNREIDRELELCRYADSVILGPAAPFVALSAAFVPAAVVLSDVVDEPRRFYLACMPVGLFLAALTLSLAFRALGTSMVKHGHQLRVAVLRAYVADRSVALAGYMTARVGRAGLQAEVQQMADTTLLANRRRQMADEIAASLGLPEPSRA